MTIPLLQRARDYGVSFAGKTGEFNAITDVAGISVGYTTKIAGDAVRTGVTAILPRYRHKLGTPVFAGVHSLNGNGELTGAHWIEEAGQTLGPITITHTHACGIARDATISWLKQNIDELPDWLLPVAAETYDGYLNDINGKHIADLDVFHALDNAHAGPIKEGSVGGGTGMVCYGYKGGSGTASRIIELAGESFTLGAFVQANFGRPEQLCINGIPVGRMLKHTVEGADRGSIIAVLATDAPLLPHQLKRLARRCSLGIGRSGAIAGHGSGDIFIAFSTANADALSPRAAIKQTRFVPDASLDELFEAVIQSVDEAILNALFVNTAMLGYQGHSVPGLPIPEVMKLIRQFPEFDH